MDAGRDEDIAKGMELVARLGEVFPERANARVRALYKDIEQTLRVPFVNLIFRLLANDPDYLEVAWQAIRPIVGSYAFERAADDLRSRTLIDPPPPPLDAKWRNMRDFDRIHAFTDSIHYVLPKLLLIDIALGDALSGRVSDRGKTRAEAEAFLGGAIPVGPAPGTAQIDMVAADQANGPLRDTFESIKACHRYPAVVSYYRALGNWPDFLHAIWCGVSPYLGTTAYVARAQQLLELAERHWRDLSDGNSDGARAADRLLPAQRADFRKILDLFCYRMGPEMLLDVALIKCMIEGPEAASFSPFSITAAPDMWR